MRLCLNRRLEVRPQDVGVRHAVRQLAALLQLPARLPRRLVVVLLQRGDVGRLIDHEQRVRLQVVEERAGRQEGGVQLDAVEGLAGAHGLDGALEALALLAPQPRELYMLAELTKARRVDE